MLGKKIILMVFLVILTLAQTACGPKQTTGGAIGAGTGAVVGAAVFHDDPLFGALFGGLLGGFIGSGIGASLDEQDRRYMQETTIIALQNNQAYEWHNEQNGHRGGIYPASTHYDHKKRQYCREFTQKIMVADQTEEGFGTACLQPDGSWKIVR